MANVTLSVPDSVLRRARVRAVEQGTSVNAILGAFLEEFAGPNPAEEALTAFVRLADGLGAGSGSGGRRWTRDELHDRPNLR
jgi:hypothetical protein